MQYNKKNFTLADTFIPYYEDSDHNDFLEGGLLFVYYKNPDEPKVLSLPQLNELLAILDYTLFLDEYTSVKNILDDVYLLGVIQNAIIYNKNNKTKRTRNVCVDIVFIPQGMTHVNNFFPIEKDINDLTLWLLVRFSASRQINYKGEKRTNTMSPSFAQIEGITGTFDQGPQEGFLFYKIGLFVKKNISEINGLVQSKKLYNKIKKKAIYFNMRKQYF